MRNNFNETMCQLSIKKSTNLIRNNSVKISDNLSSGSKPETIHDSTITF